MQAGFDATKSPILAPLGGLIHRWMPKISSAAMVFVFFLSGCAGAPTLSPHLTSMREYSIQPEHREPGDEIYRFLFSPTFGHPVVMRLDVRPDGSGIVTVKKSDGKGGYDPGKLVLVRRLRVSRREVETFREVIEKQDFWSIPSESPGEFLPLDGVGWTLEALVHGKYHDVMRVSPDAPWSQDVREEAHKIRPDVDLDSYLRGNQKLVELGESLARLTRRSIFWWSIYEKWLGEWPPDIEFPINRSSQPLPAGAANGG